MAKPPDQELPGGEKIFLRLLPWAMGKHQYRNVDARQFSSGAFSVNETMQRVTQPSGRPAWPNHVAFALKLMTEKGLHVKPGENDRVHYKPDHARIQAYLMAHPSDHADNPPSNPLAEFIAATKDMPRGTEVERLAIQRIGQGIFRRSLMSVWNHRCPVTGIDDKFLLRASHIRRWACCESDEERMDADNGLLLGAHIDAAFEVGLISFSVDGDVLRSSKLSIENARRLGVESDVRISMSEKREHYMKWHRRNWGFETDRIDPQQASRSDVRREDLFDLCARDDGTRVPGL